MPLLFALIALNLAFGLYLFISLRRSPEGFWDKSSSLAKAKPQVTRTYQFYDAFPDRRPHVVGARANPGQC